MSLSLSFFFFPFPFLFRYRRHSRASETPNHESEAQPTSSERLKRDCGSRPKTASCVATPMDNCKQRTMDNTAAFEIITLFAATLHEDMSRPSKTCDHLAGQPQTSLARIPDFHSPRIIAREPFTTHLSHPSFPVTSQVMASPPKVGRNVFKIKSFVTQHACNPLDPISNYDFLVSSSAKLALIFSPHAVANTHTHTHRWSFLVHSQPEDQQHCRESAFAVSDLFLHCLTRELLLLYLRNFIHHLVRCAGSVERQCECRPLRHHQHCLPKLHCVVPLRRSSLLSSAHCSNPQPAVIPLTTLWSHS